MSHKTSHIWLIGETLKHILKRGNVYHYNRRVPTYLRGYHEKEIIRISLKTDSYTEACKKAVKMDHQIEVYWQGLLLTGSKHSTAEYRKAVLLAQQRGFAYKESSELGHETIDGLVQRMELAETERSFQTDVALGAFNKPRLYLSDALENFWPLISERLLNMSPNQIRKWRNPRIKAVKNFIQVVGDMPLDELTKKDTLAFKDWWVQRIKVDNLSANSANKDMGKLKDVLSVVSEYHDLEIDIPSLFTRTSIKEAFKRERQPFETQHLVTILLSPSALAGLNKQARYFLYAMAETGARGSELVELRAEDIRLDHLIPHIEIKDRLTKKLKTPFSNRTIPLVGFALEAFKCCPDGFSNYRDRFDSLSNLLNKYLRTHSLLPSVNHSVYSLRHSFQDRLTSVNTPDRVQAQLMGHKFARPEYGKGSTLELKKEWMNKICLKNVKES